MPSLGDRRSHLRLEVVGSLWGTFDVVQPTDVVDISANGVLILATFPASQNSLQTLHFNVYGETLTIPAHVRRLERVLTSEALPHFYIGLEFLTPPVRLLQLITDIDTTSQR